MADTTPPPAIRAAETPLRARASGYPAEFAPKVAGREKRPLGDIFGLSVFGVNLTRLAPGAWSALHHRHTRSDEFIYVLEGTPMPARRSSFLACAPAFPLVAPRTTWRTAPVPMW